LGGLNILINNAGLAYYGPTHLMTMPNGEIMAVNLLAPIQLVRALLPTLLAADEAHILNMCSMFGLTTWRKTLAYQTTNSASSIHGRAARGLLRDHFGVTALCPGFVQSALVEDYAAGEPHKRRSVPAWICATPKRSRRARSARSGKTRAWW